MSETIRLIFTVTAAFFEMIVTMIYCDIILKERYNCISKSLYCFLCICISVLFWFIRIPNADWRFNLIISFAQVFSFTLLFESEWIKRIFSTISYLVFSMISEISANSVVMFLCKSEQTNDSYVFTVMLSKLIKFIFVLVVMLIIKKKFVKAGFRDYFCLMAVPIISIFIIIAVTIQSDETTVNSSLSANIAVTGILVINFIVYYLLNDIIRANEIRQKQFHLEKQFQYQEQKYQQTSMSFRNISSILHDTNKHLLYLRECAVQKNYSEAIEYIDTAIDKMDNSYKRFNTGFLVIDALISNAYNSANINNIKFRTNIKIDKSKIDIERYDLSVTLGNLLDNAIEACLKIAQADDRFIDVNIHTTESVLVINIINSAQPSKKKNYFVSDKGDLLRHGYGLGNVSMIAEKYGGVFTVEHTGTKFEAIVTLPLT